MKAIPKAAVTFSFVLMAASIQAQNWVKVANEGDTVTASAVTVRYGSGTWTAPQVMSGTFVAGNSIFGDPAPNVIKELDVLETSTAQAVVVNGASVIVPAAPAPQVSSTVSATVTTKDQSIKTTAPTVPAQKITITTPRNGGQVTFTIPAQTLPTLTATVPGQTAPVTVSGQGFALSCPTAPTVTQPSISGCTLTVTQ